LNLSASHNVPVVGNIPAGLPKPRAPRFDIIGDCLLNASGIAAVVIAVHISMAKLLAKRMKYVVDSGQELYALGFATLLGSFFSIYPVATALGRTMVSVESGSKTQNC
uniref:Sulfate_transp domain-containing protein n=1 Tax=Gongylonema pulchrum TaxID=637853 RepID=A0A183ERV3_9BILA